MMVFVKKIQQINHARLIRLQRKAHPRGRKAHPRGREREGPKAELELPTPHGELLASTHCRHPAFRVWRGECVAW